MGSTMENMLGPARGWRIPFLVLILMLGAIVAVASTQYRRLMRSNSYLGGYR